MVPAGGRDAFGFELAVASGWSHLHVLPKTFAPRAGLIRRMIMETSEDINIAVPAAVKNSQW